MDENEISPVELLRAGFAAPEVAQRPWCVRWDETDADVERLVLENLPPTIEFETSGSTGPSRRWLRVREKVWDEAGLVADLLRAERPDAIVSFVPSVHLYGALASVLVPARLGVPVWFRPTVTGSMPPRERTRWVVVATPWVFTILLRHIDWVRAMEQVTVLHGGAMLPVTAGDFLAQGGEERALIVEVLGSTEAGGVATRRWRRGDPPSWTLFPDVSFDHQTPGGGSSTDDEVPLAIRSPRLAFPPGGSPPETWVMDDYVQHVDERRFRFGGRRSRLAKVNGRRMNLDDLETSLRSVVSCADLALMPVEDSMIGEHVDLLVVPHPGETLADVDLKAAITHIGLRPRSVRVMERIERSETGKLRRIQPAGSGDSR